MHISICVCVSISYIYIYKIYTQIARDSYKIYWFVHDCFDSILFKLQLRTMILCKISSIMWLKYLNFRRFFFYFALTYLESMSMWVDRYRLWKVSEGQRTNCRSLIFSCGSQKSNLSHRAWCYMPFTNKSFWGHFNIF